MNQDINLNLYKVFYWVATLSSFKKASDKLCVSQPAISKQIKNLEEILGVKLFFRLNKGIKLTKEGLMLLEQVEKMNFYLEASVKYISSSKKLDNGELVIGCQSHITSFYLLKYIEKFKKDYAGINIKIISDSTSLLIEQLLHHKIDFIIDNYPIDIHGKNIVIKKLKTFDTALIVNNGYNEKIKTINDLNNKNFILPLERSSMRKNLEKVFYSNNINVNVGLAVDTTDLIISSIRKGFGIGYVVKESVKKELENKEFKELKIDCELPKFELELVYIKDYLTYPAKEFLKKYIKAI